jgi:hypothetical protein
MEIMHRPTGDTLLSGAPVSQGTTEWYPKEETLVGVSIHGSGPVGMACDGSFTKNIRVFNDSDKKGVVQ